ncbi:MAG: protein kinase [bacterium]|nr:protein kinase [bacterium]
MPDSVERWRRVEAIFDEALELPAAEVPAHLDAACGGDDGLRGEVEALLGADQQAGAFLETSAGAYAATLIREALPATRQDPLEGRRLGPYRVLRRIGGGGMGVVYEAVDTRLFRRVALKLLPTSLNRDPDAKERFVREARAASALDHPNICAIHDIGETDGGRMFIVMAYYGGRTLESMLADGPLEIDDALDLAAQVSRGLERAHEAGIVHRDIKPANVIVTEHGEVKVLDFGIAKIVGEAGLTRSGVAPGTPAYMSPEQTRGEPVDERADVWSLGAVLYQLIAGRRPFEGRNEMAIYMAIQEREPKPLGDWRGDVPEALERAVMRALVKEPAERTGSVAALLDDLAAIKEARRGTAVGAALREGVAVRTLLLIDLVASTRLAQRLGDRHLAEVSAEHDRLARDVLAAHGGLEIDKTDGFLLLFERPIDAVGCALAYHRGVAGLSEKLGVDLAARAGLHLGEVHLRRNPPEDVARGAKPIEVEGLAKPIAARVMSLAGGRQTLVTQSAFELARRAADELALEDEVRWLAHGDYLLEGVAGPIGVFEVGAPGFAPLAAPVDSEKARRAVAAEEVVLGWRPAAGAPLPERPHWVMREKLGEGGFGEVWLAGHDKTDERRVFKFCYEAQSLKALEREVTFFRLMKEALGDRDDIVRILDWNFARAPFYLESEYTAGGDLIEWAASEGGLAAVPLETRLELVAQVARALGAAHSVGILHKDVKPGNVLITTGPDGAPRARLTDFGVGLVADRSLLPEIGVTLLGLTEDDDYTSAGTHLYLAPEILEGRLPTVQADLYALGVMLYQMVVGDFSRALARGWQRDVDDEILREDIACFVDGSPERRPAGAGEIAERLQRLDARRAEREAEKRARREAEEARRAVERGRRRRRALATAVAALVVFGAAMAYQVRQTRLEARRAEHEAAAARQVSAFLEDLFEVVDPSEARGNSITARAILDRGARRIEDELADQPEIQARLMGVMGAVYRNLGLYEPAGSLTERALELGREVHGDGHAEVAASLTQLGRLLFLKGDYDAAEAPLQEALAMRREILGDDHEDVAETLSELGNVLSSKGDAGADVLLRECLRIRRLRFEAPHDKIAGALFSLAFFNHFRDSETAEELYREALAMYEQVHGDSHPVVGDVLNNYGHLLKTRGDLAAAEPLIRRSIEIARRMLGEDHHLLGIRESNLARLLIARGEYAAAEDPARRAVAISIRGLGVDNWQTAISRSILGASLAGQGRYEEAEKLLVEGYRVIRAERGDDYDYLHETLESLIAMYDAWDKVEQAANYRDLLAKLEQ